MRWTTIIFVGVVLCAVACDGSDAETPTRSSASAERPATTAGLRCPANPRTTLDLEVCARKRTVRLERAIRERVRSILSRGMSAAARGRFRRAERTWLAYRRALCASRADVYEGGSAARVVLAQCVASESASHLKDLGAFDRDLRRGRE